MPGPLKAPEIENFRLVARMLVLGVVVGRSRSSWKQVRWCGVTEQRSFQGDVRRGGVGGERGNALRLVWLERVGG